MINDRTAQGPHMVHDRQAIETEKSITRLNRLWYDRSNATGAEFDRLNGEYRAESAFFQSLARIDQVCSVCGVSGVPLSADGPVALICAKDLKGLL
jgi:hypothetical protein